MDVRVELQLNHSYLFDPPHIFPLSLQRGEMGGESRFVQLYLMWNRGMFGGGERKKLYVVLITPLC